MRVGLSPREHRGEAIDYNYPNTPGQTWECATARLRATLAVTGESVSFSPLSFSLSLSLSLSHSLSLVRLPRLAYFSLALLSCLACERWINCSLAIADDCRERSASAKSNTLGLLTGTLTGLRISNLVCRTNIDDAGSQDARGRKVSDERTENSNGTNAPTVALVHETRVRANRSSRIDRIDYNLSSFRWTMHAGLECMEALRDLPRGDQTKRSRRPLLYYPPSPAWIGITALRELPRLRRYRSLPRNHVVLFRFICPQPCSRAYDPLSDRSNGRPGEPMIRQRISPEIRASLKPTSDSIISRLIRFRCSSQLLATESRPHVHVQTHARARRFSPTQKLKAVVELSRFAP